MPYRLLSRVGRGIGEKFGLSITSRGVGRQDIFLDDEGMEEFLEGQSGSLNPSIRVL